MRNSSHLLLTRPLQQVQRTFVNVDGRVLSYFGGCDYYRLASHPVVLQAASEALFKQGLNVAASRMTTGNHELFAQLERDLARFFKVERALLFSNGYLTNQAVVQAIAPNISHTLIDEKAHPSLQDASRFLDCPILSFKHRDPQSLKEQLRQCGPKPSILLMTDGLFAFSGEICPLAAYAKILPKNAWILLDDAHGAGVLGSAGRGTADQERFASDRLIQTISLSKAFGAYGGAVLSSEFLAKKIVQNSRSFSANTPLPLPLVKSAQTAVAILGSDDTLRRSLRHNTARAKRMLVPNTFSLGTKDSPMISARPLDRHSLKRVEQALLANEIFSSVISYAGGPKGGYFRFAVSSEHRNSQIDALVDALVKVSDHLRPVC